MTANWGLISQELMKRGILVSTGVKEKLLTLSNPIQVHPDQDFINKYKNNNNINNIDYPDTRLENFLNKNDIKYINTAKQLRLEALEQNVYFHGFENTKLGTGHWNKLGHSKASKLISSQICSFYD